MNNAQADFLLEELQQQTNGTTMIEAMKAELAAILLNAEGGLKKRLSAPMTTTQFKVLDAFFKIGLPTLPLCPHCKTNVHVEFRYFNNRTKTRLVQPRFGCKVCFAPPHSPEKEWNQQKQEENVNNRKKLEFTLHQEELEVLVGAWGGLHALVQRFWSMPHVIEVLEANKFILCSSRRRKSESPTNSSPKRKRRSWESKQVNDGGSTAENMIDHQMPLIRDHHDEDMLWMESFNSIIAAERLGSSSAAYSPRNTNPNNNDSDWYHDYYMSCSNLNNNNIAAFTW
mgnify:FL=1